MNQRKPITSNSTGGLGNRLKSYWSALRLDPAARIHWQTGRLAGVRDAITNRVCIEPLAELFDRQHAEVAEQGEPAFHSSRLLALGDEPALDDLYNETPRHAATVYRRIASNALPPTCGILRAVDRFAERVELSRRTGIHVRTQPDNPNREPTEPGEIIDRLLPIIEANRPCYLATDTRELRKACNLIDGVVLFPGVEMLEMFSGQWRQAFCEMLALGRCRQLMVTKGSTFSECAYWLGGASQPVRFITPLPLKVSQ